MDSVFGTVRCLPGDGDPFLDVLPLETAAGSSRPGDPDAKPPAATCRCPRSSGRRCAFSRPAEIVDLAEAIHARYRVLVFVGAYGGLRIGELAGLRPSRVDLRAGAVTVAEILTEVKGKLIAGPPQDARRPPNRRAAALRRP
jgi:integrase